MLAGVDQRPAPGYDRVLRLLATGRGGRALVVVTGSPGADELAAIGAAGRQFTAVLVLAITDEPGPGSGPGGTTVVRVADADHLVGAWAALR